MYTIVPSLAGSASLASQIFSPTYTADDTMAVRSYNLEIFASALTLVVNVSVDFLANNQSLLIIDSLRLRTRCS